MEPSLGYGGKIVNGGLKFNPSRCFSKWWTDHIRG